MVCEDPTIQLKVCGAVEVTPSTVIERFAGLVVTVTESRMSMGVLTVALSTVAVPLPAPEVLPAVYVEVCVPLLSVVLVGFTLLSSVPPNVTGVPLGTLNPPVLLELCVRSAVRVEVAPVLI